MNGLEKFSELRAPLEYLLTADNDETGRDVKRAIVEDISLALAKEMNEQFALGINDGYLEPFAFVLQKRIKNAEIRNLHVVI